jgi:ribosomal subunit interface protein
MRLTISGNVAATEAMVNFANQKLAKLKGGPVRVSLRLDKVRERQQVSIIVFDGARTMRATDASGDMYDSIGGAVNKLQRRLRKDAAKRRRFERAQSDTILEAELMDDVYETLSYTSDEPIEDDSVFFVLKNK